MNNFCSDLFDIDGTLTDTTTPGQSGPGSNSKEVILHTPQTSRTGASPSDTVKCHTVILFTLS